MVKAQSNPYVRLFTGIAVVIGVYLLWPIISDALHTTEPFATGCDLLTGLVGSLDGDYAAQSGKGKSSQSESSSEPKWVKKPVNRVIGGYKDGADQWVCQGTVDGAVMPGRTWDTYNNCNVAVADKEVVAQDFAYLDAKGPLYWTKFPAKKVQGGMKDNNKLYVCHGDVNGDKYIGTTWNTHPYCDVGIDGKNKSLSDFEYLSIPVNNKKSAATAQVVTAGHVDNWGSDIKDFDASQAVCKSSCISMPACNIASHNGSHCWLKTGIDPNNLRRNGDITSLIKLPVNSVTGHDMPNTDYPNNDFAKFQADSLEDCKNFCKPLQACKAAAFDSSGSGTCWLKSTAGEGIVNGDRQSWLKQ